MYKLIEALYKNNFYPSEKRFYEILKENNIKPTHKDVKEFINNQAVNQIHKPILNIIKKLKPIFSIGENEQIQMDLIDYTKYKKVIEITGAFYQQLMFLQKKVTE